MITKIQESLPSGYRERVTRRAAERGIANVWTDALDRAKAELGDAAAESDIIRRAAIRAQQRVGVLPRLAEPAIVSPAATAEELAAVSAVSDSSLQAAPAPEPETEARGDLATKRARTKPETASDAQA